MSIYQKAVLVVIFVFAMGLSAYLALGSRTVLASCDDSCGCYECLHASQCYGADDCIQDPILEYCNCNNGGNCVWSRGCPPRSPHSSAK